MTRHFPAVGANAPTILAVFALAIAAAACQQAPVEADIDSDCSGSEVRQPDSCDSFNNALAICRVQHSGTGSRRLQLPPTDVHVATCLRQRGWTPSGTAIAATDPDVGNSGEP